MKDPTMSERFGTRSLLGTMLDLAAHTRSVYHLTRPFSFVHIRRLVVQQTYPSLHKHQEAIGFTFEINIRKSSYSYQLLARQRHVSYQQQLEVLPLQSESTELKYNPATPRVIYAGARVVVGSCSQPSIVHL